MTDLVSVANSYGTTGDPTKNVNVTNNIIMVNGTDNQNVTVTNWPTQAPTREEEPTYRILRFTQSYPGGQYVNVTWSSYGGSSGDGTDFAYCGGYSRMYIYAQLINITHTTSVDSTSITLGVILWNFNASQYPRIGMQYENFDWQGYGAYPPTPLNLTCTGIYLPSTGTISPIAIKAPYCQLAFFVPRSNVLQGSALLEVVAYLRND